MSTSPFLIKLTGVMKYYPRVSMTQHNLREGTYRSPRNKSLDNPALLPRRLDLTDSKRSLDNIQRRKIPNRLRKAQPRQLQHTPPRNTGENELVLQRRGDKLALPGLLVLPDDEEIAPPGLGHLAIRPVEPQNLVESQGLRLAVRRKRRAVVRPEFGVPEATWPRADGVFAGSE